MGFKQLFNLLIATTPAQTLIDIKRVVRYYALYPLTFDGNARGMKFGNFTVQAQEVRLLRIEEKLLQVYLWFSKAIIGYRE
ncbi:hypothetical protein BG74_02605 [Sodalis-like endosymbiont of Proechinophthirus fluctus]|nr:hypothetical protein BG74_02605 [Sodalis-like endosymbiont of Proechinophthirus fluctus]